MNGFMNNTTEGKMNEQSAETWYRAVLGRIETVQVRKATKSFVTLVGGRREKITTDWTWLCPTWQEAKDCLVKDAKGNLEAAKERLESAQYRHDSILKLTQ